MKTAIIRSFLLFAVLGSASTSLRADVPFLWGVTGTAGAPSNLYVIRPTTGKATLVGSTGLDNVSGLSVHPVSKLLYATQGQLGTTKSLVILNKRVGSATTVGDLTEAIADSAFNAAGTFFIYGAASRDLFTVNLATAAKTLVKADAAGIGACGITFNAAGSLYMTRSNSIALLDSGNGNVVTSVAITGATTDIDNLLATRSDGVIFGGQRTNKAAPTRLFTVDPTTGVSTLVSAVPLSLSGMAFDLAPKPLFRLTGPKTIRTSRTTHVLRGKYTSNIPCDIVGGKSKTTAKSGPWRLTLRNLRTGKNRVRLVCTDAVGQRSIILVNVLVSD